MSTTATEEVRDYYDLNTARWFARPRDSDAIHRAVWGEGVTSQAEAFQYVDRLVLRELAGLAGAFPAPLHVLDLGCGIGNSLIFLASHAPVRGTGVTLSGVQAEIAARHIQQAGLTGRVECLRGGFLDLPKGIAPAQLAFSIEAFVHSPDPGRYFTAAAGYVEPARDLLVAAMVGLGRHLPLTGYRWRSLVGGNALQAALLTGLIEFRFVVWQKG